jgi:hypothetical protein
MPATSDLLLLEELQRFRYFGCREPTVLSPMPPAPQRHLHLVRQSRPSGRVGYRARRSAAENRESPVGNGALAGNGVDQDCINGLLRSHQRLTRGRRRHWITIEEVEQSRRLLNSANVISRDRDGMQSHPLVVVAEGREDRIGLCGKRLQSPYRGSADLAMRRVRRAVCKKRSCLIVTNRRKLASSLNGISVGPQRADRQCHSRARARFARCCRWRRSALRARRSRCTCDAGRWQPRGTPGRGRDRRGSPGYASRGASEQAVGSMDASRSREQ